MKRVLVLLGLLLCTSAFAQGPVVRSYTFGPVTLDSAAYTTGKITCFGAKHVILHIFCNNDSAGTQADSVQTDSLLVSVNDSLYTGGTFGPLVNYVVSATTALAAIPIDLSAGKFVLVHVVPLYDGPAGNDVLLPSLSPRSIKIKVKPYASYYSLAVGKTTIRRMKAFTVRAYVVY